VPGFNDAHIHFTGIDLDYIDFRGVTDPEVLAERVAAQVEAVGEGELVRGGRWDHEIFPGSVWPTKRLLDPVSPANPVILDRVDGHSVLVNSYVLDRSGITADTPDPPGGEIVRSPGTGEPTGILKETARRLIEIQGHQRNLTPEEEEVRTLRSWQAAMDTAAKYGITSVQLPPGGEGALEVFRTLQERGALTLRAYVGGVLTDDSASLGRYEELRQRYPRSGDWIRFGYLKGYIDGTLSSSTALLFKPFTDEPDKAGLPQMPYEELERRVLAADGRGFQVGVHAIGDRANHWVLNAYGRAAEVNGVRDARHRIEHASILRSEDIPRFAHLGVIASTQAVFVRTDNLYAEKRLGPERSRGVYPWRALLDAGAHVAFGTDWDVEPMDPRQGLYAAVTRKDWQGRPEGGWFPEHTLTLEEAIRLYTLEPAYAEFMEDRKGMLRPGYLADLVVFNRNLLDLPPEAVLQGQVDLTVVGGEVVFRRARSLPPDSPETRTSGHAGRR
jgi:predicted amidohydrolase YtcJ